MNIVKKAKIFATQKHGEIDHRRKYTNEPYITHPAAVVEILMGVERTDTIEDTNTTLDEISDAFGIDVLIGVDWLTNKYSNPKLGSRKIRKMLECMRYANAPAWIKTIKLADTIHNCRSILDVDKDFAKIYLLEKRDLLTGLCGGESSLYWVARDIVIDGLKEVELWES